MITDRDLGHRLNEIERRLDDMRTAQSSFSSDGTNTWLRQGDLTVNGGTIRLLDAAGEVGAVLDAGGIADSTNILTFDQAPLAVTVDSTSFAVVASLNIDIPTTWNEYNVLGWWQATLVDVGGNLPRLLAEMRLAGTSVFSTHADPVSPQRIVLPATALWTGETTTGTRTLDVRARLNSVSLGQEVDLLAMQLVAQTVRTS